MIIFALTTVILVVSASCQSPPEVSASNAAEITVVTTEFKFTPDTVTLKTGDRIRLTLDNSQGKLPHVLKQADLGISVIAEPGQKATFEFVVTKAGKFDFVCSLAGHKEAGMVGEVVVQP